MVTDGHWWSLMVTNGQWWSPTCLRKGAQGVTAVLGARRLERTLVVNSCHCHPPADSRQPFLERKTCIFWLALWLASVQITTLFQILLIWKLLQLLTVFQQDKDWFCGNDCVLSTLVGLAGASHSPDPRIPWNNTAPRRAAVPPSCVTVHSSHPWPFSAALSPGGLGARPLDKAYVLIWIDLPYQEGCVRKHLM